MPSHPDRVRRNYPEGVPVFGLRVCNCGDETMNPDGICDVCEMCDRMDRERASVDALEGERKTS